MPEMDGYQATAKLRSDARFAALPIIAMTAHATIEERQRCLAAGMNDHISKPIDPAALFDAVGRFYQPAEGAPATHQPSSAAPQDALPSIAGLDIGDGLARVAGNQKLYVKILRQFVEQQGSRAIRSPRARERGPRACGAPGPHAQGCRRQPRRWRRAGGRGRAGTSAPRPVEPPTRWSERGNSVGVCARAADDGHPGSAWYRRVRSLSARASRGAGESGPISRGGGAARRAAVGLGSSVGRVHRSPSRRAQSAVRRRGLVAVRGARRGLRLSEAQSRLQHALQTTDGSLLT